MNEEVQKMIDHSFEYAQELITDTKEFYPFGAFIDTIGNVHPLEFDFNPKQMPTVGKVLESLSAYCEGEIEAKKMRGYALTFEAELQLEEDQPAKTCIALEIKHIEEASIPSFYQPFSLDDNNTPLFEDIFAVKA